MEQEKKANAIRLIATAIVIAEYGLLKLKDNTHQAFKQKVNFAITSCQKVQQYFSLHENASPETKATFKEQFLSGEIVLLSELLESCFGIEEEGLEEIINAIKQNQPA